MVTEYEKLLQQMIEEGRARLEELKSKKASVKKLSEQESSVRFVELELARYRQGLTLFRTKNIPKVGRWGKPEVDPHAPAGT